MYAVTKLTTLLVNGESTPADAILSDTITNQFSLLSFYLIICSLSIVQSR